MHRHCGPAKYGKTESSGHIFEEAFHVFYLKTDPSAIRIVKAAVTCLFPGRSGNRVHKNCIP
ncbi:MAG: hypothetical protein A2Y86_04065 [Candidatus Aminicenantes bacterium RBG_13_62_12]|nr:MAG: hypothetical protein A2Y86_04065 [Candidatus Aminicenantes bacterium RBG_13_62_12]